MAEKLISLLKTHFPKSKINFDMHDCDKVLRIEGENLITANIIDIVKEKGFVCAVLQ